MLFLRLKLCRKSNFHNSFFKDYLQTITNNCCLWRSDCSMIICQMLCVFCWISVWIPVLYRKLALKRFQPLRRGTGLYTAEPGCGPTTSDFSLCLWLLGFATFPRSQSSIRWLQSPWAEQCWAQGCQVEGSCSHVARRCWHQDLKPNQTDSDTCISDHLAPPPWAAL